MRGQTYLLAALLMCGSTAAAADEPPICPDRPSKATGPCTVPAGHWQVETGLIDWTHDRSDGETSDFIILGSSLIKYGVSDRIDIELGVTPLEIFRAHGAGGREHDSSFGDTLVRMKYALTGDNAAVAVTLDPFVKLPTANHELGNGKVEGGLTIPISAPLGKGPLTLAFSPEIDWRADADGHGHHAAMIQLINLGLAATSKLSLGAELWGQWDWDPAGTSKQYSADGTVAYLLNTTTQLDAGANFGLNKQTPDVEVYAGVSKRF